MFEVTLSIVLILAFILVLELALHQVVKRTKSLLKEQDVFPTISKSLLDKFNTFDPELGWVNKPDTVKYDQVRGETIKYTFDSSGSRLAFPHEEIADNEVGKNISISTYGDSFCQCREVNDNETWQHYLGQSAGINIKNFGVGNYGLDQAYLRLKNEYDKNPTDIVILQMVPLTIMRITSVWKHFSEPFNVLNFKPRFKLNNNDLEYMPSPISDKYQISKHENYKDYVLENDDHFNFFKSNQFIRPYSLSLIYKSGLFFEKALWPRLDRITPSIRNSSFIQYLSCRTELKYRKKLYIEQNALLQQIISDFVAYSNEKKFTPILLVQPQMDDLLYIKHKKDIYYEAALKSIKSKLRVVDATSHILKQNNFEKLYVYGFKGGHHSPTGNKFIAGLLYKEIFDRDSI